MKEKKKGEGILGVDARVLASFQVHDACADILFLAARGLALAVKVPDTLGQRLEDIWAFARENVVDAVRRGQIGLAAFEGACNAQQADNVGVVGVEELPFNKLVTGPSTKTLYKKIEGLPRVRAVYAHFINLRRVLAQILDMAQHMPAAILAHKVSQIRAQAHVCNGGFGIAPFGHRQALEQDEAAAVEELLAELEQEGANIRKREVVLLY